MFNFFKFIGPFFVILQSFLIILILFMIVIMCNIRVIYALSIIFTRITIKASNNPFDFSPFVILIGVS